MSKFNQSSIGDAIKAFIMESRLKQGVDAARVQLMWEKLMGKVIAKHTTSINLKNGTLYIKFDSPALKNEMHYSREKIKEVINNELGEEVVKEVWVN